MTHSLQNLWDKVTLHLNAAFNLLPQNCLDNPDGGRVSSFEEFLEHNELELALDELEGLSEVKEVKNEFWKELFEAASLMELKKHVERYSIKLEDSK